MPVNPRSEARMGAFLRELAKNGVHAHHLSRSIYLVNSRKISFRTTTKPGPKYWYDISKSIMDKVEYLIYQTDTSHHFVLFPSSFFIKHYYDLQDSNRPDAKQFYIDWANKCLISDPRIDLNISEYCCSLYPNEEAGLWKKVLIKEHVS